MNQQWHEEYVTTAATIAVEVPKFKTNILVIKAIDALVFVTVVVLYAFPSTVGYAKDYWLFIYIFLRLSGVFYVKTLVKMAEIENMALNIKILELEKEIKDGIKKRI